MSMRLHIAYALATPKPRAPVHRGLARACADDRDQDLPTLEAGYDAWVEFVRKTVPRDRLLEFDVKQGWGPLCEFLGKPVHSTSFPHINDRVVVDVIIKVFQAVTWIWPLVLASPFFLLWGCCRCCRSKVRDDLKKNA